MKTSAFIAIFCLVGFWLIAGPNLATQPNGNIGLIWTYDTNQLSTNLSFNIYETTNVTTPLENWNLLTNVVGTNLSVRITVVPGEHFFVVSASNFWGDTSMTSSPGYTPPLPIPISNTLRIEKEP